MAQKCAHLDGQVMLAGRNTKSIKRVFEEAVRRVTEQKKKNPRTDGKQFTFLGNFIEPSGKFFHYTSYCEFSRPHIKGNFQNDVVELFRNVAKDLNVDVTPTVISPKRTVCGEHN